MGLLGKRSVNLYKCTLELGSREISMKGWFLNILELWVHWQLAVSEIK